MLRTEVTINKPRDFSVYRASEKRAARKSWRILRRGVADLTRRAVLARWPTDATSMRWQRGSGWRSFWRSSAGMQAGAQKWPTLPCPQPALGTGLRPIGCGQPWRVRARNRDLRILLFLFRSGLPENAPAVGAAAITRKLRLFVRTVYLQNSPDYRAPIWSPHKVAVSITALLSALNADVEQLTKMAA